MSSICIMDTSVFLNILKVPGRCQGYEDVCRDFLEYAENDCTFILPMATIIETGNHIAQCGNGFERRSTANRFIDAVKGAYGKSDPAPPWRASEFPSSEEVLSWIDTFPDMAMTNKSSSKTTEGTSFGDLSIIEEYHKCCRQFSMSEVFIWSLDSDLKAYFRRSM